MLDIVYFKKAGCRVVRVVAKDWVELEVPGYRERFFVELSDPLSVGPAPLPTLQAKEGSTGDLYLSTDYLFKNGVAADLVGDTKYPAGQGGSFAESWRYLNSPARTPAIAAVIAGVRDHVQARRDGAASPAQDALVRSVRGERAMNELMSTAFPYPEPGRGMHLDRVARSLVAGVVCGALR